MKKRHESLIFVDFDHTLFNTTMYVKQLADFFDSTFGVPRDIFLAEREAVKTCCVVEDIDLFVTRLPHDDKAAMHDTLHQFTKERARTFVFPDAIPFIEEHRNTFDMMILTHGDIELQTEKITHSGLPGGLPYIIVQEDKRSAVDKYHNVYDMLYVIDDKAKNITKIKKTYPDVVTYYMVRPEDSPYAQPEECKVADHRVQDLKFRIE